MSVLPGIRSRGATGLLPARSPRSPNGARRRLPAVATAGALAVLAALAVLLLGVLPAQALVPPPDMNEPNDSFVDATALKDGVTAWGAVTARDDEDYFYFDLANAGEINVDFTTGGYPKECRLAFRASGSDTVVDLTWEKNYDDDASFFAEGTLGPGRLFAIVSVGNGVPGPEVYTITITVTGEGSTSFPDVAVGSDYYTAITYLAEEGVVSGYSDGRFGPNDLVTRQQFAKMIVRAVPYAVFASDVCSFPDVATSYSGHYVDPNDPLYPDHYVAVAAQHHITVGITATTFGPYQNIKMAQVTTMIARTAEDLGLWDSPPHAYTPPFADFGGPHYPYAREGAAHGLFNGYPGPWSWFEPATRGQCSFFIWKLMVAYHGGGGPEPVY